VKQNLTIDYANLPQLFSRQIFATVGIFKQTNFENSICAASSSFKFCSFSVCLLQVHLE